MSDNTRQPVFEREVVAVFNSMSSCFDALDALRSNGIDRARATVLAPQGQEPMKALALAGFHGVRDLLGARKLLHSTHARLQDYDAVMRLPIARRVHVGGAIGTEAAEVATGRTGALNIAAVAMSVSADSGIMGFLTRRMDRTLASNLGNGLSDGDAVLWVLVETADEEAGVIALLTQQGGRSVSAHPVIA